MKTTKNQLLNFMNYKIMPEDYDKPVKLVLKTEEDNLELCCDINFIVFNHDGIIYLTNETYDENYVTTLSDFMNFMKQSDILILPDYNIVFSITINHNSVLYRDCFDDLDVVVRHNEVRIIVFNPQREKV